MTALYLFGHDLALIKTIPEKDLLRVQQLEELQDNDLPIDRLTAEYKLDAFKDVDSVHYMAVKDLDNPNQFHMYYVTQPITNNHTVVLEGKQLGHKELKHFIVREIHPQNRQANFMLNQVLTDTEWRVGYVDDTPELSQHFYYLPALECLKVISGLFGLELVFKVEISGQKITDKWVEAYHRRGAKTMKRFTHGSNLLSVKGTIERSEIYTALIGRGRGEETETGGFGRRITFEDVEWSVANGDPVDKPLGQNYVEIPQATAEHGINRFDGSKIPALGVFEEDQIEEPSELLQATYGALIERIRPLVLYQTTVADIGAVELGEVVGIHRYDLGLHYETRIKKLERNYLDPKRTPVELGDQVYEGRKEREQRLNRTINAINADRDSMREEINYVLQTADGKNVINYGNSEPEQKRVGDLWFRDHPTKPGHRQMLIWNGDAWEIELDTSLIDDINETIDEAKGIAEQARDHSTLLQLDADSILAGLGIEGLTETNQNIVNQIKANVGDRIDELVSNVDELPTVSYVNQEVNRVEGIITTEIGNVTSNPTGTIAGYNSLVQTVEGNEQLIASIKTTPEAEIVGYQRIIEQVDLYERVIGSTENDIENNVARIVMSDVIFQTEVSDGISGLSTTVSQLSNSWALTLESGTDIITAINATPAGTYIGGKSIILDGDTIVDGTFTVTDEIFAENMSISKFTTGTLNAANVNLINLNASSIVSGTLSGANMFLNLNEGVFTTTSQVNNQLAGSMTINHGRLESVSNVGTGRFVTLSGDQLHFGDNDGYIELTPRYIDFNNSNRTARMRFNGTNLVVDQHLGMNGNHINSVNWIRMIGGYETVLHKHPSDIGGALVDSQKLTIGLGFRDNFTSIASFYGRIDFMQNLHMNGNNIQSVSRVALNSSNTHLLSHPSSSTAGGALVDSTRLTLGIGSINTGFNDRITVTNSQIDLRAHTNLRGFRLDEVARIALSQTSGWYMHLSSGSAVVDTRMVTIAIGTPTNVDRVAGFYGRIDFFKNLNMNGNVINNQSDARLKYDIFNHDKSSLATLNALHFVDFKWVRDGREDFGLIAQEVQQVAPELISEDSDGYLSINNSLLNMMTTHAIQELSKEHDNTLLVASHAYILAEQHEDELSELKEENKKLKERVEALEGAA